MEPGDGNGDAAAEAFFGPWSINERKEKPVQFLREDPMNGSFLEAVWHALNRFTGGNIHLALIALVPLAFLVAVPICRVLFPRSQPVTP